MTLSISWDDATKLWRADFADGTIVTNRSRAVLEEIAEQWFLDHLDRITCE